MKVVILAGGLGTRISEETVSRPKPMIEIGSKPILWHLMKMYSSHGFNEFIICCGYKGYVIKEYFANYFLHMSDVTIDLENNQIEVHYKKAEKWKITLVDTGEDSMTGGRLKRIKEYIGSDDNFFMTYGDCVSDVDISATLTFHKLNKKLATVTAVYPPGRFGILMTNEENVIGFSEKPEGEGGLINGGFFVLSTRCLDLIDGDQTVWEREPMETLAKSGQLVAYQHNGFWQPMDTLRDKNLLEKIWDSGTVPWKKW